MCVCAYVQCVYILLTYSEKKPPPPTAPLFSTLVSVGMWEHVCVCLGVRVCVRTPVCMCLYVFVYQWRVCLL